MGPRAFGSDPIGVHAGTAPRPGWPLVIEAAEPNAPLDALRQWIEANRAALKSSLLEYGAIAFRGFHCVDRIERFEHIVDAICPRLMPYLGGTTSREPLSGRIGTASGARFTGTIPVHQEMSYQDQFPTHLVLFCQEPASQGGETLLASARGLRGTLPPAVWDEFAARGIRTRRRLSAKGARWATWKGRPWNEALLTEDPAEAERVIARMGWDFAWMPDGGIEIDQPPLPAMRTHPETGEEVWFNQCHLNHPFMVRTALRTGRRHGAWLVTCAWQAVGGGRRYPNRTYFGDGAPIPMRYPRAVQRCLDSITVAFPWQRTDFMILDNYLVMHGRAPFRGSRTIGAALLTSAFESPRSSLPAREPALAAAAVTS